MAAYDLVRNPERVFKTANITSAAFAGAPAYATAQPVGNSVFPLNSAGRTTWKRVKLWPIVLGSDNDALEVVVYGIFRVGSGPRPATGWFYSPLGSFSCIGSAYIGAAGSYVLSTERFADTLTILSQRRYIDRGAFDATTEGPASRGTIEVYSPADDTPGYVIVPTLGAEALHFDMNNTVGTPSVNFLLAGQE